MKQMLAGYKVRPLTEGDIPEILVLCQGNPLYYEHMRTSPSPESIREDMTKRPRAQVPENKFFLGLFREGKLAAVLDLIVHHPKADTAFIGWFILRADLQGRGEGSRIMGVLLEELKSSFAYVRLGRVKGNSQSQRFWEKNGFMPTGLELPLEEDGYTVVVLEKAL